MYFVHNKNVETIQMAVDIRKKNNHYHYNARSKEPITRRLKINKHN